MGKNHVIVTLLASSIALSGCVEKSQELTRSEREQLSRFVGEEPTRPAHEISVDFEGKIELIGYDLSSETWAPGSPMTLTWHWKVNRALEDGWHLFTHVSDGREDTRINEDLAGTVRELYQPGRWSAGEYIRDAQTITLPEDWNASTAIVYVGLWHGDHRLRVTRGPSDGDNRARAATIPVSASAQAPARPSAEPSEDTPTLIANRAEAIEINGELNEAAWRNAPATDAFVNTMTGTPSDFRVVAKTLWDDENLYVAFEVEDDRLVTAFDTQDDHLWERDCVEIMLDPDGDGRNYFEMQVSPRNVSFDTRYDTRRQPQPIGHADWDSNLRSAVVVRGEIDDDDDDDGYTAEIAIPWASFNTGTPAASPPSAGESWRANFYVMDSRDENSQRANGWSPPKVGDFHVPARFGTIRFQGPQRQRAAAGGGGGGGSLAAGVRLPRGLANRLRNARRVPEVRNAERDPDRPGPGETMPTPENPRP